MYLQRGEPLAGMLIVAPGEDIKLMHLNRSLTEGYKLASQCLTV